MNRETVEVILKSALSDAEAGHATSTIAPRLLASFCRRWLAVEDAPKGRVDMICAADAVVVDELPESTIYAINKQRVRLVPEAGQGGGE